MLKCYDCMEKGKDSEAVSVCIVCGKGLCMDHARRMDLPIWSGNYPTPAPTKRLKKELPRILCNYCIGQTMVDAFD
ncbi:MAG: DUF2180 family protein [Methanosarcinaceae archaeon]|nr:DUF2180 family protein [Methanosarcinaceae archaeon]